MVSRFKNAAIGGVNPNTPYNYIPTNAILYPNGASFAAASPYNKVTFKSFFFGFVVQDVNGGVSNLLSPSQATN